MEKELLDKLNPLTKQIIINIEENAPKITAELEARNEEIRKKINRTK